LEAFTIDLLDGWLILEILSEEQHLIKLLLVLTLLHCFEELFVRLGFPFLQDTIVQGDVEQSLCAAFLLSFFHVVYLLMKRKRATALLHTIALCLLNDSLC
jgi:hypothetical protein